MADESAVPEFLEVEVSGTKYRLGRVGFALRVDAQGPILEHRKKLFRELMDLIRELPEPERSTATLAAFDTLLRNVSVSNQEVSEWLGSPSGELFLLYKALLAADPKATEDQARALMDGKSEAQSEEINAFLAFRLLAG